MDLEKEKPKKKTSLTPEETAREENILEIDIYETVNSRSFDHNFEILIHHYKKRQDVAPDKKKHLTL
ncbi:hypothetical protein QJS83_08040 [Bdellovibrio sp. 22V]|uniref:hypothetical protein n=1 Tax=Bdellovibrio sp. 22V TaxID=3044166 RepID=UPI002543695A|nr:hypothetical protein [Bdellovibrio sp. 22V]WII73826.1 hypothetical protein QJS83_08040 [Bdellovibrio sp. 22V]